MIPDDALVKTTEDWRAISGKAVDHPDFAFSEQISSAPDLLHCLQAPPFDSDRWIFRGQGRSSWRLQPTIERLANEQHISPLVERFVEREFKRRAHHYLVDLPNEENDLEWLALMQHHGAPTRLLDWTRSAYVAAFFAAESAEYVDLKTSPLSSPQNHDPFVIWAIDLQGIRAMATRMLGFSDEDGDQDLSSRENFRKLYGEKQPEHVYFVAPVQPYRMNARLTIQQGLFLCPNHPLIGFERCLKGLLNFANKRLGGDVKLLHKLTIDASSRLDVLGALSKMNITAATLYPGLDGFARSLRVATELLSQKNWHEELLRDFTD